jgi:hypothetical protein
MSDLNLGVPQGKDLFVDASNVTIVNLAASPSLSWKWLCPTDFDCSGLATDQKSFSIAFSKLKDISNMDFMKKYTFVLQIRAPQNLPRETPFMQRIVNVTWLGPPKNVTVVARNGPYSIS